MKKIKQDYVVSGNKIVRARLPHANMSLAVWRLFIDPGIPRHVDEVYQDFDYNFHFVTYEE